MKKFLSIGGYVPVPIVLVCVDVIFLKKNSCLPSVTVLQEFL